MDIQHILERWLVFGTVGLCLVLALLFAALQAGIF
jgi:hypothetical protein